MTTLEESHQMALIEWASLQQLPCGAKITDYLFHIPNGGARSKATGGRLKAMGTKRGVSDLFLPYRVKHVPGLWIELKAEGGRPSKEQRDWLLKMGMQGYATALCDGWEAAKRAIQSYIKNGSPDET